jgi:hypothetical protein
MTLTKRDDTEEQDDMRFEKITCDAPPEPETFEAAVARLVTIFFAGSPAVGAVERAPRGRGRPFPRLRSAQS